MKTFLKSNMQEDMVLFVNGPNLNLLGTREPEIYGSTTLVEIEERVTALLKTHHILCKCFQSNSEGDLIDFLHQHRQSQFLIMNPGAFTHTSIALRDAVSGIAIPMIEVHISNVYQRESFRKHSYFSEIAIGTVIGLGIFGYEVATQYAIQHLQLLQST